MLKNLIMKNLVFLLLFFCFLPKLVKSQVFFQSILDEKDVHSEMGRVLESIAYNLYTTYKKPLYIKKIDKGVVYIDKSKYNEEEIKFIEFSIEFTVVGSNISTIDKPLTDPNELGFDSGKDADYVWKDEEERNLSSCYCMMSNGRQISYKCGEALPKECEDNNSEQKTKNFPKSESSWYLKEQTTLHWFHETDTIYFKDSKISVSGVIHERFDNNNVKICAEYVDGIKNGFYKEYFKNGNLLTEKFYVNGSILYMTVYSSLGSILQIKTKPDENGFYFVAEYFPESKVESSLYNYLNGKKHGFCIKRYAPNQMEFEGEYDNGKCIGVHKYWYSNGKKERVINYAQDKYHGLVTFYFENGQIKSEGNYINGKKDGTHLEFFENGQLKYKGNYKNEKNNGLFESYYKNGQLKFQGNYLNGLETGLHKRWYEYNGQLSEVRSYVNGKIQGKSTWYYENGNKDTESETINNTRTVITWHSNGTKIHQGTYIDNKKEGVHYEWYDNGAKKSIGNYKNGKLHGSFKEWYSNGNLKFEKNYNNGKEVY